MTSHINELQPLQGEEGLPPLMPSRGAGSRKPLIAVSILALSVVCVVGFAASRYLVKKEAPQEKAPDVASTTAGRVKFPEAAPVKPLVAPALDAPASAAGTRVPSIELAGATAQPIPVRGGAPAKHGVPVGDESPFTTGPVPNGGSTGPGRRDESTDGPQNPSLSEAQANLKKYQSQLGDVMGQLKSVAGKAAGGSPTGATPTPQSSQPLFGSLERSSTPKVLASQLGDRSLTMPKGTTFMCSLKSRVITATSGFVGCQLQRNVFSDDGKVVLAERGAHLDGEYRVVQVRPGVTRIPVLWTRIRMPNGVTVDLDSPATGPLGESGIGGYVDNRWVERVGAALMLSLIQDAVQATTKTDSSNGSSTVVLTNTTGTGSKLAEKILETTINIPPLIYSNQGSIVGVYVARDVDFSSVYNLVPQ